MLFLLLFKQGTCNGKNSFIFLKTISTSKKFQYEVMSTG